MKSLPTLPPPTTMLSPASRPYLPQAQTLRLPVVSRLTPLRATSVLPTGVAPKLTLVSPPVGSAKILAITSPAGQNPIVITQPVIASQISLVSMFGSGCTSRADISNEVYHADRSCVSTSGLKEILRSPAHYAKYLKGDRKETPTLFLGTAIHARLLEPGLFNQRYVVYSGVKRGKEWKEFEASNAGKLILSEAQFAIIEGIAQSVSQHQSASTLIKGGLKEHTIIWQDEETGIWIKMRPDCLSVDFETGICLDVKSTEDASAKEFARSCVTYDYDLQAALYLEGLRKVYKRDFDFCFLPVEKAEPHGVALYGAPFEMIERGQRRFRQALRTLKACRDSGKWPSYQPEGDYEVLDWPRWAA